MKNRFYSIVITMTLVVSPALQAKTWKEWALEKYEPIQTWFKENPAKVVAGAVTSVAGIIGARWAFRKPAQIAPIKETKPAEPADTIRRDDTRSQTPPPNTPRRPDKDDNGMGTPEPSTVHHRSMGGVLASNPGTANAAIDEMVRRGLTAAAAALTALPSVNLTEEQLTAWNRGATAQIGARPPEELTGELRFLWQTGYDAAHKPSDADES